MHPEDAAVLGHPFLVKEHRTRESSRIATAMTTQSGKLTTKAADASARSKARFAVACRPDRRTGFSASAIAGPTFSRDSRR